MMRSGSQSPLRISQIKPVLPLEDEIREREHLSNSNLLSKEEEEFSPEDSKEEEKTPVEDRKEEEKKE